MNPQQTLTDIYNQISVIREFICSDSIFEKDKITELPKFENGTLSRGLIIGNDTQIAFTYNLALQKICQESFSWSNSKKRKIDNYANSLFGLLEEWKDRELNSFHLITILNGILLKIAEKEKQLTPNSSIVSIFGVQYGNREVSLDGGGLVVIEVLEYPDFVGKEFYYSGTLPASQGITVAQGVFAAIYSDLIDAYTQYRIRVLAPSLAIPLTQNDTKLLLTAYDTISTRITIYE